MPRYICKLQDGDKAYYLEWSTVVDAPVTFGMSLEEFRAYYQEEYGRQAMEHEFDERMERVEKTGTSCRLDESLDDTIEFNVAGKDGTCLSKEQIIEAFCRHQCKEDDLPMGKKLFDDDIEE